MNLLKYAFFTVVIIGADVCNATVVRDSITPVFPVPEKKQIAWQQMETYAFVHFGLNTFNDREWGYGNSDSQTFNPTHLDCEQWVDIFVKAGLKGVILTAKHHDGFCLWPSAYTEYSVKNSPWMDGKGDLLRLLSDACRKKNIKFGVYLSPWDRNHSKYGTPAYIDYLHQQLNEVMTHYGDLFEVWFDGANGGDGWYGGASEVRNIDRRTYYNFPNIFNMVEKLQPQAVIFSDGGPGCRWVGNESGFAGETNWSFLRKGDVYPGYPKNLELQYGHSDGNQWTAAECDVSMRPGWFYHPEEDSKVISAANLTDLYYRSVGHNATLLINFPIDRSGRVNPIDSASIVDWRQLINSELADNILKGIVPVASSKRGRTFAPQMVTDGLFDTYWATKEGINSGSLTFTLPTNKRKINRILIQEYIPLGQRVKNFILEYYRSGKWYPINVEEETTTIGYKRIVRFATVETKKLRINFINSRGPLCICNVEAYYAASSYYSAKSEIKTTALPSLPYVIESLSVDLVNKMQDGDVTTVSFVKGDSILLDLGSEQTISHLSYLPDQHKPAGGMIASCALYVGSDTNHISEQIAEGEFSNIKNNPIWQTLSFAPLKTRYLLLKVKRTVNDSAEVGIAELSLF
ncbi:MAG: alpha-L-fucosidase [Bacteroides sp.]